MFIGRINKEIHFFKLKPAQDISNLKTQRFIRKNRKFKDFSRPIKISSENNAANYFLTMSLGYEFETDV